MAVRRPPQEVLAPWGQPSRAGGRDVGTETWKGSSLRILCLLTIMMLPLLLTMAVAAGDRPLLSGRAPFLLQEPRGLVWAGRDFTSYREFNSFLSARGASYETWAKRHPGAAPLSTGPRARDVYAAWALGVALM